jgi:hypothetical protein
MEKTVVDYSVKGAGSYVFLVLPKSKADLERLAREIEKKIGQGCVVEYLHRGLRAIWFAWEVGFDARKVNEVIDSLKIEYPKLEIRFKKDLLGPDI